MKEILSEIKDYKYIVVKVGTSTITYENGKINLRRVEKIAKIISDLKNSGKNVVLVTSGAVGLGLSRLNVKKSSKDISLKQAAASVGQSELMNIYGKAFSEYGYTVGQILITRDIVNEEKLKTNAINTFKNLEKFDVIPIVNENDTVSTEELEAVKSFGDNDSLSAIVAVMLKAQLLIILSDIEGLYDKDPKKNSNALKIDVVDEINENIYSIAQGPSTSLGTGGMLTKINAAKFACENDVNTIILNGEYPELIYDVFDNKQVGTLFLKKGQKVKK